MSAKGYLSREVEFGGKRTTLGEMIDELQRIAETWTEDRGEQRRLVDRYVMGYFQSRTT